ncbi:CUB and sushi domain-containing protein 3-like isoform X1 [Acropora muricata]|uniref:CUB and sushi domain-containing protein 3-like isoform X1 n=1 Tax=Acropora muricata TaxID=159855 RepID=UPI0034E53F77
MKNPIVVNLLTFLALQWLSKTQATHFRHAIITWAPANSYSDTLILRFRMAFRRSFSSSYNCDQSIINSGALRGSGGSWRARCSSGYCSSRTIANTGFQCTDFSVDEDWTMGENNFTYTFSSVSKEWVVSYQGCCWISSLVKYPDGSWLVSTTVNLTRRSDTGRINSSPVSKSPAIIRFKEGCPQSFRIPVEDPDDDVVKCRWATYSESFRQTDSFPHGVIDERACLLQYNGRNRTAGTYAVALTLEDFPEGTTDFSSITGFSAVGLQFLVIITARNGSCNDVPLFTKSTPSDGECTEVQFGSAYRAVIEVKLQDLSRHVTEIVTSSPVGMQLTPLRHDALLGIFYRNITWYPSQYQVGQQLFCFKAKDSAGSETEWRCITILVGLSNTPRVVLGTQWPRYPSSQFGTGFLWLSIQFDRVIKKPRTSAFVRLVLLPSEHTVYKVDTLSRNVVISANKTTLLFALPKAALSMKGSYAILIDRGAVVGLGCSFDGPPTPGISSPQDWVFNAGGICSTGYSLDPPYYRSCVDVNECGNPSRKKRYAWWWPVTSTSSSPTPTIQSTTRSSPQTSPTPGSCVYNLTNPQGNFTSPNHPSPHQHNLNCFWTIIAAPGRYIHLYFLYFSLEHGSNYCPYDYVEVTDPNYPTSSIKIKRCGYQIPWCVTSTSNVLYVRFVTDHSVAYSGFFASYTNHPDPFSGNCTSLNATQIQTTQAIQSTTRSSPQTSPTPGSCVYNLTNPQGNFTSPNHPSPHQHNLNCFWTIIAAPGRYIHLYFLYFSLEHGSNYCPYDYVEVTDPNYPTSSIKIKRCGYQIPWCVTSTSNVLYVRFVTDHSVAYSGFFASYTNHPDPFSGNCTSLNATQIQTTQAIQSTTRSSPQTSPTPGSCVYNLTNPQGNFTSPNHPSPHQHNLNCFWTIIAAPGRYIHLYFLYFSLEHGSNYCPYDYVEVTDPNYPTSSIKIKRCGYQIPWCVTSTSNVLYVRFVTDHSVAYSGFFASYTNHPDPFSGNCTSLNATQIQTTQAIQSTTRSSPQTSPTPGSCVYNLTNPQGNFTSPNHPSPHQHNLNCFWTIIAAPGRYIHLYFLYFSLEHGSNYCPYDYVEVTDPNYPTSSIKIKRCGYQIPWCVTSTSNVLYVRFVTDHSVAYSGFFASYTNHPDPFSGNCTSLNATQIQTTQAIQSTTRSSPQTSPTPGSCVYNLTNPQGNFTSPNHPSPHQHNLNCFWTIIAAPGRYIHLYFLYFSLEHGSNYCPYDYVEVTDPNYPTSSIKIKRCGYQIPWCVTSTSNVLYVRFVTDHSVAYSGFFSSYTNHPDPFSGNCTSLNATQIQTTQAIQSTTRSSPQTSPTPGSCVYNLTNPQGNFTSPNHPSPHQHNLNCFWTIIAAPGRYIHLYFLYFSLEHGSNYCPYDYVEVTDPNYPTSSIKIKRCGYQIPWCVTSTSNVLYVRFVTDHSVAYSGFFASYTNHPNPFSGNCTSLNATQIQTTQAIQSTTRSSPQTSPTPGSCVYNLTNPQGNFTSPNHPSPHQHNLNCFWTIIAAPGRYIHLYFLYFSLEHGSNYCPYDYVEVTDPNYPTSSIKIKRCGYQIPWCVTSTSNVLYVRFVTDGSVAYSGFFASYANHPNPFSGNCASLNATQIQTTQAFSPIATSTPGVSVSASPPFPSGSCGYNFTDRQGNLTSPNYPYSYPNNLNCLWTITATPGDCIYLYFTYFYVQGYYYPWSGNFGFNSYCPYDYVEIFDLNYPSSFIKVRGCGYQSPWCVKSKGHVMHIRFVTNSIYSYTGFRAHYAVYRNPPAGGNCLFLNPYDSSSRIIQATPILSSAFTSTSVRAIYPTPASKRFQYHSSTVTPQKDPDFHLQLPSDCEQVCHNTPGSYICSCVSGFQLASDGKSCSDINECSVNNGGCSHHCYNIPGAHYCGCPEGTTMAANNLTCVEPGVTVTCGEHNMSLSIEKQAFSFVQVEQVHLRYSSCKATENDTHLTISTLLNDCGTSVNETEDALLFWNELRVDAVIIDGVITRSHEIRLPFYCSYSRKKLVSLSFRPLGIYNGQEAGYGNFTFRMAFFKSGSFVVPYSAADYPLQLRLNDYIYVRYSVESSADLVIMAENCRATKDGSFYSLPQYNIIQNGCGRDTTMVYSYNSNRAYQEFRIKVFRFFNDYSSIYFHCELLACHQSSTNSRCRRGCLPGRRRKKRAPDNSESTTKNILSLGPIDVQDDLKQGDAGQNKKEVALIGGVAGAGGVCILAFAALGFLFVKYRVARRLMNRNKVGDLYATQEEEMGRKNAYIQEDDMNAKEHSL